MGSLTFNTFARAGNIRQRLAKPLFISLLSSFIFLGTLYLLRLRADISFLSTYGYSLFFLILSFACMAPTLTLVRAQKEFPCMSGMMIGMTAGMVSGFLAGYFVAITHGMFVGGIFGMAIGILLGVWNGKCCGIMGVLEGIMAGFMGGLMGAMTAVMMLNEAVRAAGIVMFIICAVILVGLNYMIYKEIGPTEKESEQNVLVALLSIGFTGLCLLVLLLVQRGGLFA